MRQDLLHSLKTFESSIFDDGHFDFEKKSIELFNYQYLSNEIYRDYCQLIGVSPEKVDQLEKIPFLPISFFKSHKVISTTSEEEIVFESSGTSGKQTSKHFVHSLDVYKKSFMLGFNHFYGEIANYCVLGLLPAYLERKGSSLVYMVNELIEKSNHPKSGFFLHNKAELNSILKELSHTRQKTLLIGVSFGLLDFIESYTPEENKNLIIMETGGMKGRRKELIRAELHDLLKKGFNVTNIHSEYGMTELLSQAYAKENGQFKTPPWMKVLIRKPDDPFSYSKSGESGAINVIDLANIYSCAFIQTDDLGKKTNDTSFEILGRFDAAEVRGCNLMVS